MQVGYDDGIRSVAICFMHGYRYHDHEKTVAEIAREVGFTQVSVSHEVSPLMKLVGRGDTTVVDAYVSPILRRYVDQVASSLGDVRLMFMQSNGGLTDARFFQGKDSISVRPRWRHRWCCPDCGNGGLYQTNRFRYGWNVDRRCALQR